jgi:ribosomal protein S18 acetylase RimI-like enzyme
VEQVIVREGEPAGWVMIGDDGAALCCVDIAIRPQARGAGLGTAALRELQARAAALDRPLVLSVRRDNGRARALYARLGFLETSISDTHAHMEWRHA